MSTTAAQAIEALLRELKGLRPGLDRPHDHHGVQREKVDQAIQMGVSTLLAMRSSSDKFVATHDVTRVEVIDEKGRSYTKYCTRKGMVMLNFQDDERTLKVFIDRTA